MRSADGLAQGPDGSVCAGNLFGTSIARVRPNGKVDLDWAQMVAPNGLAVDATLQDADPSGLVGRLSEVVAAVGAASSTSVTAAAAVADSLAGVPEAATEANEVVLIARHLRRPPGVYVLDDVLMEYQLTRPGPARDRLARRLDPLAGQEHLLAALHSFFEHDHNTRLAAADLHVHANTLQYRLRRGGEITGLDPTKPSEARLLSAAILADLLSGRST